MWPTLRGEGSDLMGLNLVVKEGRWTGAWASEGICRYDAHRGRETGEENMNPRCCPLAEGRPLPDVDPCVGGGSPGVPKVSRKPH